jgi:cold shock CspA family protein
VRSAEKDFRGNIVPINDRNIPDSFLHFNIAQRAGIEDVAQGDVFLFDCSTDPRHPGKTKVTHLQRIARAVQP